MSDHPVDPRYTLDAFPRFEPPHSHFDLKIFEVMYDVSGRTRAENHLITIAQDEFLKYWLSDECMTLRLEQWRANIGLPEIVTDIANFLDCVAERYGFSRRADLGRTPRPAETPIEDLLSEWYHLQDRLYAAYQRGPEVVRAVIQYVHHELQLPWPWLVFRLTYHLFQQAWERALGITMVHQRVSYLDDYVWGPYAQHSKYLLEINDSEPLEMNKKRLKAEFNAFIASLQSIESERQSLKKGKVQPAREITTRRNTQWFYRHRVCGDPKYQIAKKYHMMEHRKPKRASRCKKCEDLVHKGIKSAETLLGRTVYYF